MMTTDSAARPGSVPGTAMACALAKSPSRDGSTMLSEWAIRISFAASPKGRGACGRAMTVRRQVVSASAGIRARIATMIQPMLAPAMLAPSAPRSIRQ